MPRILSTLLLACLITVAARAADFPYEAYVSTEQAEVIAGPGHRYYATDRLARGTKIEIYREDASGWLAIRPPEGSFSWIPAEFIEKLDDPKTGRVTESTGAWIGTTVEHVTEHQQQVTLKVGEVVQILSDKTISAKSSERTWLKIAPPAGEFRWVHLRDVSRQKPEEPKPQVAADTAVATEPQVNKEKEVSEEKSVRLDPQVQAAQFRTAAPASNSPSLSPDGFVPRKRRTDEPVPSAPAGPTRAPATPIATRPRLDADTRVATATPRVASTTARLTSDEIARQLDQVEIDLSLMLSQDRSKWNLAAVRDRVNTLVESGADPAARGRARLVLDKIKQFEEAFDASSGPTPIAQTLPATKSSVADPRYDAQGWLKPVISRKSEKPAAPFAVVDAEGKPVCFISPSPGLNLNRYLNKQVGLYGRRGFLEELKKPHLMAERIVEIDSHLR